MSQAQAQAPTVSQLSAADEPLARLLEGVPAQMPVTLANLRQLAEPGRPLNRLTACVIMLDYLRVRGR